MIIPTNTAITNANSMPTTIDSTSSTSSSVNLGPIVGGAIGGVVLLGAIFAFAWHKIKTFPRSQSTDLPRSGKHNDKAQSVMGVQDMYGSPKKSGLSSAF